MDIDPQYFFQDLNQYLKDGENGHQESFRMLDALNRNLIEELIDSSLIDVYLIHIFHAGYGLLQFIETSVKNKKFKLASKAALEILYTIMNNLASKIRENDVLSLYRLCTKIIKSDTDSQVKMKLFEVLLISLEKNSGCIESKEATSVHEELLAALQNVLMLKHCDTVKDKEMKVLGLICKKYRYFVHDSERVQKIFLKNFELYIENTLRKTSQSMLDGFFTGFNHFLESFPLNPDSNDYNKIVEKLYKSLKGLVEARDKRKSGNRAGLMFLANNMALFKEKLLDEYEFWHRKLNVWLTSTNVDDKKVGAIVLGAFHRVIAAAVAEKEGDAWRNVVIYFNNHNKTTLASPASSNYEIRLAIASLRHFSRASHKHLSSGEVANLFLTIMQYFEKNFILNHDPQSEHWQYLPDYIQTVAQFMAFKGFTAGEFFCLQKAAVSMVKSFHRLPVSNYGLVVDALVMTLFHLKGTQYFDVFLKNFVYQGVVWSCSHQHLSNLGVSQNIVTVKNYFPLWTGILALPSKCIYNKYSFFLEDRKYILDRLVGELVKTLMVLINKLNLNVKLQEDKSTLTDVEQAYKVEDIADYAIFLNIVDFYQEIFANIQASMLKKCICKMLTHLIDKCLSYPLTSGFYKLLSFCLRIAKNLELFPEDGASSQDIVNCQMSLTVFLPSLLDKMSEFKDELLISQLLVLLESPIVVIKDILPACIAPFVNIFEVGRSYLSLAKMGVDTLEYWQENVEPELLQPVLIKIIPSMDSFLRSKSLKGCTRADTTVSRRKTRQALKKRKVLLDLEPELVMLQKQMLCFVGRQSLDILRAFVFSDSTRVASGVIHCGQDLKVTLPYEDLHLDVYLDGFLPRIVDLALHCSDRKTRIMACELLQACVMVFLGRAKPMNHAKLQDMTYILKMFAMPLLQLGCDIDQVVQQIFRPLFIQLVHWYTSPTQARGPHASIIIDVMMEGITHPTNSSLRDFSGKCVNEHVEWTIKHSNDDHLDLINFKILVKHMRFFSCHPDSAKKLGAALIFNNIYRAMREEDTLISIFWLEILHIFVLGLSTMETFEENNTVVQMKHALRHLQRVFIEKAYIFREIDEKRRVPKDLGTGLLQDVAVWLLRQTGCLSRHCREMCKELFVNVAALASKKHLRGFIQEHLEHPVSQIYYSVIGSFEELKNSCEEDGRVLLKWLQKLLCALDGYNFIIKHNLEVVRFDNNPIFEEMSLFLKHMDGYRETLNAIAQRHWICTAIDLKRYEVLRWAGCLSVLRLFNSLLHDEVLCAQSSTLWGWREFWGLVVNLTFRPQVLGLWVAARGDHRELLTVFFNALPRKLSMCKLPELSVVSEFIAQEVDTLSDLQRSVSLKQRNLLEGLLLVQATSCERLFEVGRYAKGLIDKLVHNFCTNISDGIVYVNDVPATTLTFIGELLKFSLSEAGEFEVLVKHLHMGYLVRSAEFAQDTSFGRYFFSCFTDALLPVVVERFDEFVSLSLTENELGKSVELVGLILAGVVKDKAFRRCYGEVLRVLYKHWSVFARFFGAEQQNLCTGLEYVRCVVAMCDSPDEQIRNWLVKALVEGDGVEDVEIFGLLVLAMPDNSGLSDCSEDLNAALTVLERRLVNQPNDSLAFDKLLTFLPLVRSSAIFRFLLGCYFKHASGTKIASLLASFCHNINESMQKEMMEVAYSLACGAATTAFEQRHLVCTSVVPTLFQNCSSTVFERFYVDNIEEILRGLQDTNLEAGIVRFVFVELLFFRQTIDGNDAVSVAARQPKLLSVLLKSSLDAFKLNQGQPRLLRLYKCHAYNALASIISNAVKKNDFYDKLFVRQVDGVDVLWRGVIDTEAVYDFPLVFDSIPDQRKVLVNIRDELRQQQHKSATQSSSLRYIESQRLFNSSLSEDVTEFDFTNSLLRTEPVREVGNGGEQNEVQLDSTEVNSHPCMATVCGLIRHIFDTGVSDLPTDGEEDVVLPSWMNGIRETLLNKTTHTNVKIFLVKVIDNVVDIFSRYAKWFLEPLVQFVVEKCAGNGINYFVTDVLVILSKWSQKTTQLSQTETRLATDLLSFLIENIHNDRSDIFKYNLDIFKMIVESWKDYLSVPVASVVRLISTDGTASAGIHVASVLLVNRLKPWEDNNSGVEFLNVLLERLNSTSKSVYRPCAETIGLVLRISNNEAFTEIVNLKLRGICDWGKYVLCLEGIVIHFPQIVDFLHVAKLTAPLNQVPDTEKIVRLKIICKRLEISLDILDETNDLRIVNWDEFLEHPNLDVQIVSMELIKKCLDVFVTYANFDSYVKTLSRNIGNANALYRCCLYDIAMRVYDLGRDETGACKEMLIFGLIDADADNREKVTAFWARNSALPNTLTQRLPFLLSEMYKSKVEDKFLGFVAYFLIDLLSRGDNYDCEVFEHPLEDCNFEDYKLQTNWRLQHPSVVPMFAETLQTFDANEISDADHPFRLRQTQTTFDFAPTQSFQEQQLSKYTSLDTSLTVSNEIKNPNLLILSQEYRGMPRRRFLKDKNKIAINFAHYETKKQVDKAQRRIDSAMEREKNVSIYRSYRKGDFPDIQIVLSSVLKPLQMLALNDHEISKTLFSEVFKGMASKIQNDQVFLNAISKSIKDIFNSSSQFDPHLFGALFGVLLMNRNQLQLEPQLISYVAQESGLVSTGALLLEEYLISHDNTPSSSKKGVGQECRETTCWIKLAELYKELEDWDTVRAIFIEKMHCNDIIHTAIQLESQSKYRLAQDLYQRLIAEDLSVDRKDFYYESYFKCFAEMGEWEKLPEAIAAVVDGANTWEALWDSGWQQQKLLPWYVRANVRNNLFGQEWDEQFLNEINSCLKDSEKNEYLRANFSEELFVMWLSNKDLSTADMYLKNCIANFLQDWQLINPLLPSMRFQKLLNLRNVIEAADFVTIYTSLIAEPETLLEKLTERWRQSSNEVLPSVLLNETRLLYRRQFISLLTEKMKEIRGVDLKKHLKNLQVSKVRMDIDFMNIAADSGNFHFARKYFKRYIGKENTKLSMAYGNILMAKTRLAENAQTEVDCTLSALEVFAKVAASLEDQQLILSCSTKLFDVYTKMSRILVENPELFDDCKQQLTTYLRVEVNSPKDIEFCAATLLKTALDRTDEDMEIDNFDNATKQQQISGAYVKLAHFARDRQEEEGRGDFVRFVLRAMKMNSSDARQLFPCVLMESKLGTDYRTTFVEECEKIPTWMFLGWIPQLLANVDSTKIFAISKIIQRIAESYPQAIMYPYRLSRENYNFNNNLIANEAKLLIDRLDELLLKDEMVNKFLKALSFVSMPAGILHYYIGKILKTNSLEALKSLQDSVKGGVLAEVCDSKNVDSMQGDMFKKIQKFKKEFMITPNQNESLAKAKDNWKKVNASLLDFLAKEKPSLLLKDYSPWLANFSANRLNVELEIPGQYDGRKMPLPQHHVKLSGFRPNIEWMKSLRRPIKLTMLGMDTKEYPFLVKFGEDVRQDQRIQQLFALMNDIFNSDTACSNNGFDILTYQVVPLTSNLGIIQWINDTTPLSDFMKKSMSDRDRKCFDDGIHKEYLEWLFKCSRTEKVVDLYGKFATKMKRDKAVAFYRSLINKVPWDIVRTSFWSLSSNTENYIALRTNFIKSYGAMCASHWLLGIGDRHLNNALVCLGNGKVLGIDFGHAFGTATQILPVPELVPFRLTPHLIGLMEPLKERGQFRECLMHCLRSLRANGASLLATMDVFISEPALDWLEHAAVKFDNAEVSDGLEWYPKRKIDQARRKLRGASSSQILLEDLSANAKIQPYVQAYVGLVKGEVGCDFRAKFETENLSVEDQVDCLIDHSTDYNLLGRMYHGWMPWI